MFAGFSAFMLSKMGIFPINIKIIKRAVFKMPIILLRGDYGHFSILICTVVIKFQSG
jgi:hypothetical protein